jgi:hypothetical protein
MRIHPTPEGVDWSFHISDEQPHPHEKMPHRVYEFQPSPPFNNTRPKLTIPLPSPLWGRGWTATGAFSSRGGPGEGVKNLCTLPRGPSRKGFLGNSCAENKGFMVQETAKNLVSGRVSSAYAARRWMRGSLPNARHASSNLLPELSNFNGLPGGAGGAPNGTSISFQ